MAEEAFALSPINARPNVPGEADYEAIREAFMETARGRWFLAEYTKRNRNADTNLLLETLSRLEGNLAAQKQAPQALSLTAALGAIRTAVRQAKATAIEVLPRSEGGDEAQTAARNGVRIVREIAMTMRECGADTRICDLLDTQVKAIEAGHAALQAQTPESGREAVLASYDALMERIEALADDSMARTATAPAAETAPEPREASVTPLFKAAGETATETPAETFQAASAPVVAEAHAIIEDPAVAEAMHVAEAMPEPAVASAPTHAPHPAAVPDPTAKVMAAAEALAEAAGSVNHGPTAMKTPAMSDLDEDLFEAEDLAVLDAVAMEMGAIDLDEPETDELFAPTAEPADEPAPAAASYTAPAPQPAVSDDMMTLAQIAEVALAPEPGPSLGAALIAGGVIANPKAPGSDPLAPIRRMTQAEKIAFFS